MSCSMSIGKGDLIKGFYVLVSPSDLDSEASTNICNSISIQEYNKSTLACTNSTSCKDPNIVEAKPHGESKVFQRCFDDNNDDNKRW